MNGTTLEQGSTVSEFGQPMTALHLITSGKITVSYPGGTYQLGKGDVIGICEICSEVHFLKYTVAEEATIVTYSFSSINVLDSLLNNYPDVARLFLLSACYQINIMLERCSGSEVNCTNFYQSLLDDYENYTLISSRNQIAPRTLNDWDMLTDYFGEEAPDLWLSGYYLGLAHIYSGEHYRHLLQESAVSSGLLRKCSLDFRRTYVVLEEQFRYLQMVTNYYFNAAGDDLFDCCTTLYHKLEPNSSDADALLSIINRIIQNCRNIGSLDETMLEARIAEFEQHNEQTQINHPSSEEPEDASLLPDEVTDSLNTILEFAGAAFKSADSFRQHVHTYKLLSDRASTDEEACNVRSALTTEFYELYSLIFKRTLEPLTVPAPVMMFLYFGYVDEELAGISNAAYLYELLDTMTDNSSQGVYTFYDWLLAIYQGRKAPSRNEFDQDYFDYVHKQKISDGLSNAEVKALENDAMSKVDYELNNMFPSSNKITNGHISTYCPLFCEDNVLKNLRDSYVTAPAITKTIEQLKKVDYTLFYRESLDKDNLNTLGKELLHFEYLPDIILMPNVGTRGIMWQEIEGKVRNSPSRMLFSIFHLDNPALTLTRMAGEFRWELCKRIQGGHWNDVSELSLTSEYFDYIQFYRKNHELSSEAKEKVRSGLQRAKNSFKEMFVNDYILWIMFEGNGSPRLNKVARRILFTYCPFPKAIRENLKQNPIYSEILSHHELKTAQRLHHLNKLTKKLLNGNQPIPDSLAREQLYAEGTISS